MLGDEKEDEDDNRSEEGRQDDVLCSPAVLYTDVSAENGHEEGCAQKAEVVKCDTFSALMHLFLLVPSPP